MKLYHRDIDWAIDPNTNIDLCIDRTIRSYRGTNSQLMIAQIFWEPYQVTLELQQQLRYVIEKLNQAGIQVIGLMHHSYGNLESLPFLDLVKIDWCLWKSWHNIISNPVCGRNQQWNNQADKFLFLTGKPYRRNRLRLLWKLIGAGLEEKMIWSLFCVDNDFRHTLAMMPELSEHQVRAFIDQYKRNPDNINLVVRNTASMNAHYGGFPYNPELFSNTLFRVISETSFRHENEMPIAQYPTEKFYTTVFNNQPWIMAGDPGVVKYLDEVGFDTFTWAVSTQYDNIANMEHRMDAIVTATQDWINEGIPDHARIQKGVEHNARLAESMAEKMHVELSQLNHKYQLGFSNLTDLLSIADIEVYNSKFHGFIPEYI